jgi:hypothetical protein
MRKIDIIWFGIVFTCLFGVLYMVTLIKSETSQCLKNPFMYGASKMENVECSCTQFNSDCPPQFTFNDTSFRVIPVKCGLQFSSGSIDWGNLNVTLEG